MPNEIQYVGIVAKDYNNRGLILHNANTNPLVRQSNGTLFAAIREHNIGNYISLFRSQDLGFSWERVWAGNFTLATNRKVAQSGLNQNGSWMSLTCHEQSNRLVLWHSYFDVSLGQWNLEPFVWRITDPTVRISDTNEIPLNSTIIVDSDQGAAITVGNEGTCWIVSVSHAALQIQQVHPMFTKTLEPQPLGNVRLGSDYYNVFHATCDTNGNVGIAVLEDNGLNYKLMFVPYTQASTAFGTPRQIAAISGKPDILDISISQDGYGTYLVVWGQKNLAGTDMDTWTSISTDGITWSTPTVINKSIGHAVYTDSATGQIATRSTSIGVDSGFLVSYCQNDSDGLPNTYVRTLTTDAGVTYTMGDERQIGTVVAPGQAITGLRFFPPAGSRKINIDDPGDVRVAYQIGEGNSTVQVSTKPVRIGQELLKVSAYTSTLTSDTGSYFTDIALTNQLLVTTNIIGGAYENVDFFDVLDNDGSEDFVTQRFIAGFQRVGTEMRFLRYDPAQDSELNDRAAYGGPTEFTSLAVFETLTYENPQANRGIEGFQQFIERDTRKIYLPPTLHISREYILNKGNFLKRTVWVTHFDGNVYEITQVVPRFFQQQIAFYTANAYVVGPMSDPFSRSILPTET